MNPSLLILKLAIQVIKSLKLDNINKMVNVLNRNKHATYIHSKHVLNLKYRAPEQKN